MYKKILKLHKLLYNYLCTYIILHIQLLLYVYFIFFMFKISLWGYFQVDVYDIKKKKIHVFLIDDVYVVKMPIYIAAGFYIGYLIF